MYYISREKLSHIGFWIGSLLGVYACYCSRSDSWLLTVGGAMLLLLGVAIKEGYLQKWWGVGASFFFGIVAMKLTEIISGNTQWNGEFIATLRSSALLYRLIDVKVILFLGVLLLTLLFLVKSSRVTESRFWALLSKYGCWVLLALVGIAVLVIAIKIFPLPDQFGSSRGGIWKHTVQTFMEVPFLQKLFGYGPRKRMTFTSISR